MITFSLSYETILFSLLALVAVLTVVVAVALYRDFRAGVFVELHPCFVCGDLSETSFCYDCHERTALELADPVHCDRCNINDPEDAPILGCNCPVKSADGDSHEYCCAIY